VKNLSVYRPCEPDDLFAIVPRVTYWTVKDDGETDDFHDEGEYDGIEQYVCFNCSGYWVPEKQYNQPAIDVAWKEALDHLKNEGVGA
jgi:hypothetical protein